MIAYIFKLLHFNNGFSVSSKTLHPTTSLSHSSLPPPSHLSTFNKVAALQLSRSGEGGRHVDTGIAGTPKPVADAEVFALPAYQKPREREGEEREEELDPVQVIYCTQATKRERERSEGRARRH